MRHELHDEPHSRCLEKLWRRCPLHLLVGVVKWRRLVAVQPCLRMVFDSGGGREGFETGERRGALDGVNGIGRVVMKTGVYRSMVGLGGGEGHRSTFPDLVDVGRVHLEKASGVEQQLNVRVAGRHVELGRMGRYAECKCMWAVST